MSLSFELLCTHIEDADDTWGDPTALQQSVYQRLPTIVTVANAGFVSGGGGVISRYDVPTMAGRMPQTAPEDRSMHNEGPVLNGWKQELDDFVRAFAGAYIFGIPLLFTMEMWWIGEYVDQWKLMVFVAVALVANLGLTYVAGFKRESTFVTTIDEAIDAVAVGVIAAVVMLLILNQIRPGDPLESIVGKIVIQAVPLSIGASVANQVFGTRGSKNRQGEGENHDPRLKPWQALFSDIGATIIGGIFIGFSIAPTDEIPMLSSALDYSHLMALVIFSLLVSYGIVFASGFDEPSPAGLFQKPFTETALAYLVSLGVAFVMLYLFDQFTMDDPLHSIVEQTLVLGVPTTVGGAAGRLVI